MRWQGLFDRRVASRNTSVVGNVKKGGPRNRQLQLEPLEERNLLAVDLSGLSSGMSQFLGILEDRFDDDIMSKSMPLVGNQLHNATDLVESFRGDMVDALKTFDATVAAELPEAQQLREKLFQVLSSHKLVDEASDVVLVTQPNSPPLDSFEYTIRLEQSLEKLTSDFDFDIDLPALGLDLSGKGGVEVSLGWSGTITFGIDQTGLFYDTRGDENFQINLAVSAPTLDVAGKLGPLFARVQSIPGKDISFQPSFTIDFEANDAEAAKVRTFGDLDADAKFDGKAEFVVQVTAGLADPSTSPDYDLQLTTPLEVVWDLKDATTDDSAATFGKLEKVAFSDVQLNVGEFAQGFLKPYVSQMTTLVDPLLQISDALETRLFEKVSTPRGDIEGPRLVDLLKEGTTFLHSQDSSIPIIDLTGFADTMHALGTVDAILDKFAATGKVPLGSFEFDDPRVDNKVKAGSEKPADAKAAFQAIEPTEEGKGFLAWAEDAGFEFPLIENLVDNPLDEAIRFLLGEDVELIAYNTPEQRLGEIKDKCLAGVTIPTPIGPIGAGAFLSTSVDIDSFRFAFDTFGLKPGHRLVDGLYLDMTNEPEITFAASLDGLLGYGTVECNPTIDYAFGVFAVASLDGTVKVTPEDPTPADKKLRFNEIQECTIHVSGELSCPYSISAIAQANIKVPIGEDAANEINNAGKELTKIREGITKPVCKKAKWLCDTFSSDVTVEADEDGLRGKIEKPFAQGRTELISFDAPCVLGSRTNTERSEIGPPNLATLESDGTLRLNMGPFAYRRNVQKDQINEPFQVTLVEDGGSTFIRVTAFGFQDDKPASAVKRIVADGGAGRDVITVATDVTVPVELDGGTGDDKLTAGGGVAILRGGLGNDELFGGVGDDSLLGGEGDDSLYGRSGNDNLEGGVGDDILFGEDVGFLLADGETSDDVLLGGDGVDRLFGGVGSDYLSGGDGPDALLGGIGDDILLGGSGSDFLSGNEGADSLYGGADADAFTWTEGAGADYIEGGTGVDSFVAIFSEEADEVALKAVAGRVELNRPNRDPVTISAGSVETFLLGLSDGADSLTVGDLSTTDTRIVASDLGNSDSKSDIVTVEGTNEDDHVTALVDGNEVIVQGLSAEIAFANSAVTGGASDKLKIVAMNGNDRVKAVVGVEDKVAVTLDGGPGDDFLSADAILLGGSGDDFLEGGAGDDQLFGNAGEDTLVGNGGKDTYDGGADFDTILVEGTSDDDVIDVRQTAADKITSTINGTTDADEAMVDVEGVRIEAGEGDDLIGVSVVDALVAAPAASLRFTVVGDAPNASDRLAVEDDGLGDLVLYRKGPDGRSGSITVGTLAPVTFTGIERTDVFPLDNVDLAGNGDTGTDSQGRLVVFEPDPFELNDTRLAATSFEFLERVAVHPTIDPAGLVDAFGPSTTNLPGDEDWFQFVASKTGTFRFDLLFEVIGTLANGRAGLPGDGKLELEVYGVNSATSALERLAVGLPTADGKAAAVGMEEGVSYWARVRGVTPSGAAVSPAVNLFDLQVVETDLFGPQVTDVFITADPTYDLFDPKPSEDGPTPLAPRLTINLRDLVHREPGFLYPALDKAISEDPGHYLVVGDHNGVIPIKTVIVTNDPVAAPTPGNITAVTNAQQFSGNAALSGVDDFYNGQMLRFLTDGGSGLAGQFGEIIDYIGATRTFVFNAGTFTVAPGGPETFQILDLATASIELVFNAPLPDDRITLTIFDGVMDPAANNLDGESNSVEPQEDPNFLQDNYDLFGKLVGDGLNDGSGDSVAGGDFVARFTIDSRPEVGTWSAGSVYIDTNGNFTFDPQNEDYTNRDLVYNFGFTSDHVFAGDFNNNGFDELAAYGFVNRQARWLVDLTDNGIPNIDQKDFSNTTGLVGMPVAGNFDRAGVPNGDEIGLYYVNAAGQSVWRFDMNRNWTLAGDTEVRIPWLNGGYPIVGDFDGDGIDDLGTYNLGTFTFALSKGAAGWTTPATIVFNYQDFIGDRERPVAHDMNQDGIDDIGLWVPDRSGVTSWESAEWYFLISDVTQKEVGTVKALNHDFSPSPLGNDLFAQFGDEFAVPIVGNFDPPVAATGDDGSTGGSDTTVFQVNGTVGDDEFSFAAGADGQTWTVMLNGVEQEIPDGTETILFDGMGGQDIAFLRGSDGDDVFASGPAGSTLSGSGFAVSTQNVEITHAYGLEGYDVATLDDSADNDKFKADLADDYAKMMGGGFYTRAKFFENVTGVFSDGDDDYARVWDSEGNDEMTASPEGLTQTSSEFTVKVENYDRLLTYSIYGGVDTLNLYDSAGDDVMRARSHKTLFWGPGFDMTMRGWENVSAHAENGGDDVAKLHDTSGDDVILTGDDWASLSTVKDEELDLLYQAYGFELVKGYHSEGKDKAPNPTTVDFLMLDDENAWDLQ